MVRATIIIQVKDEAAEEEVLSRIREMQDFLEERRVRRRIWRESCNRPTVCHASAQTDLTGRQLPGPLSAMQAPRQTASGPTVCDASAQTDLTVGRVPEGFAGLQ